LVGVRDNFDVARVSKYDSEKYARPYKRNIVDVFVSKDLVTLVRVAA